MIKPFNMSRQCSILQYIQEMWLSPFNEKSLLAYICCLLRFVSLLLCFVAFVPWRFVALLGGHFVAFCSALLSPVAWRVAAYSVVIILLPSALLSPFRDAFLHLLISAPLTPTLGLGLPIVYSTTKCSGNVLERSTIYLRCIFKPLSLTN